MLTRTVSLLGLLGLVVAGVVTACGGREAEEDIRPNTTWGSPEASQSPTPVSTPADTTSESDPTEGAADGNSLSGSPARLFMMETARSMVEWYPYILVGKVIEQTGTQEKHSPSDFGRLGLVYPEFSVEILEIVSAPGFGSGDAISVLQPSSEGVPLQLGARYLFFLEDLGPYDLEGFGGYWPARFLVSDDGLIAANGAECEYQGPSEVSGVTAEQCLAAGQSLDPQAALAALKGQTLEEAKQKILAAIAEAPLPPPPTPTPSGSGQ